MVKYTQTISNVHKSTGALQALKAFPNPANRRGKEKEEEEEEEEITRGLSWLKKH